MSTLAKIGVSFLEGKHQLNLRKLQGLIGTTFTMSSVDMTPKDQVHQQPDINPKDFQKMGAKTCFLTVLHTFKKKMV
jgi:hypothetical protein